MSNQNTKSSVAKSKDRKKKGNVVKAWSINSLIAHFMAAIHAEIHSRAGRANALGTVALLIGLLLVTTPAVLTFVTNIVLIIASFILRLCGVTDSSLGELQMNSTTVSLILVGILFIQIMSCMILVFNWEKQHTKT